MDYKNGETKKMTADAPRSLEQRLTQVTGLAAVGAGDDTSTYVLDNTYPDEITATNAAEAKLKSFQRVTQTVALSMPTIPGLFAERVAILEGFEDEELNQRYTVRAVRTTLNSNGMQSVLQLESIPT